MLIGGLLYGTFVALFVVPAVYTLLSSKVRRPLVEAPTLLLP